MCDLVFPQTEISFFRIERESTGATGVIVLSELPNGREFGGYVPSDVYVIAIVFDSRKRMNLA